MKKLPVLAAFAHALRSTVDNLNFAFHVGWPWMLVLLPIELAGNFYIWANSNEAAKVPRADVLLVSVVLGVVSLTAFSSIAVNWHRYILRDEIPQGTQRLRIDSTVRRYVGNILLISLILFACILPIAIVLAFLSYGLGNSTALAMPVTALAVAAMAASYRLGVKLPAIALERQDFTLKDAWAVTEGNFLRILGLTLLYACLVLAAALLAGAIGYGMGEATGKVALAVSIAMHLIVNWIVTILGVTMLTSLYGFFVEGREF